ncbi:maleylpyruvate isomerase family mycothiol-dependent enzyme [Gordonia oryzae]|uniref:Maleylpyruvate isomerase family mycothiol-dependent enzyme n=1 Tax=Gordonia oryzae TaxID=2487349 RepID=A0A3N4G880_9ACTN|nr:maleylpyruvate isomerase family mycothiol-dependent enzyme [Gordonia oryzae]RPA58535.1 maleylpyruvate isomerase family mycothiol-dependent enzyme [Gordonia oryzae]
MDDEQIFAEIADERRRLADQLSSLTDDQWATPSLCEGWTCRDVVAHLVMQLVVSTPTIVLAMIRTFGDFDKANIAVTAKVAQQYDNLTAVLRDKADKRFTPPGNGPRAPLSDLVIHGADIRRPLGLPSTTDPDRRRTVLDFLVTPKASRGFTDGVAPVRWVATDLDWTFGDGPEVRGPAESLMLVMTGRDIALADLTGDGVATLS